MSVCVCLFVCLFFVYVRLTFCMGSSKATRMVHGFRLFIENLSKGVWKTWGGSIFQKVLWSGPHVSGLLRHDTRTRPSGIH